MNGPFRIEVLAEGDHDAWDRFVASAPGSTLFHTAWWHRAWEAELEILALRGPGGEIVAGLPLCFGEASGRRMIQRPPLSPVSGPVCSRPPHAGRALRRKVAAQWLSALLEACPRVDFCQLVMTPAPADLAPFRWNGFEALASENLILPKEEAGAWLSNVSEGHLKKLRKARKDWQKHGCALEVDPPFAEVLPLLEETAATKGFEIDGSAQLADWWRAVESHGAGRIYLIRDREGRPLCASVLVWDRSTSYHLLGGMSEGVRRTTSLAMLLIERMIEDSHRMGLDFDFEAAAPVGLRGLQKGLEQFYRGWGGTTRPVYRLTRILSASLYREWKEREYLRPLATLLGSPAPEASVA